MGSVWVKRQMNNASYSLRVVHKPYIIHSLWSTHLRNSAHTLYMLCVGARQPARARARAHDWEKAGLGLRPELRLGLRLGPEPGVVELSAEVELELEPGLRP